MTRVGTGEYSKPLTFVGKAIKVHCKKSKGGFNPSVVI